MVYSINSVILFIRNSVFARGNSREQPGVAESKAAEREHLVHIRINDHPRDAGADGGKCPRRHRGRRPSGRATETFKTRRGELYQNPQRQSDYSFLFFEILLSFLLLKVALCKLKNNPWVALKGDTLDTLNEKRLGLAKVFYCFFYFFLLFYLFFIFFNFLFFMVSLVLIDFLYFKFKKRMTELNDKYGRTKYERNAFQLFAAAIPCLQSCSRKHAIFKKEVEKQIETIKSEKMIYFSKRFEKQKRKYEKRQKKEPKKNGGNCGGAFAPDVYNDDRDAKYLFCSELVAIVYKTLGLIPPSFISKFYFFQFFFWLFSEMNCIYFMKKLKFFSFIIT